MKGSEVGYFKSYPRYAGDPYEHNYNCGGYVAWLHRGFY